MAAPPQDALVLYEHPVSSYAQKLKIAMREKNLSFSTYLPPDMALPSETKGPLHLVNPRVEVPVLIHKDPDTGDDVTLFDSTVILEYLEERFPDPPLMPTTKGAHGMWEGSKERAKDRAKQRLIEEVVDTQYEAVNWGLAEVRWYKRAEGELAESLESNGKHHTKVLQEWLKEQLGESPYFAGERFGWADCAVAPMVNRSVTYGLGPEKESPLSEWHKRIQELESVRKTFGEYQVAVEKMPLMADVYRKGERKREYRDHRLEWMIKAGGIDVVREGIERGNVRFSWPDNP
jgi:stringent starvation protein A